MANSKQGNGKGFKVISSGDDDLNKLKEKYGDDLVILDPEKEVTINSVLLNEMQTHSTYISNTQNYWGEDILDNLLEQ